MSEETKRPELLNDYYDTGYGGEIAELRTYTKRLEKERDRLREAVLKIKSECMSLEDTGDIKKICNGALAGGEA